MLTGIHILLTYTCNLECDHCFLYCGPRAKGTFTLNQLRQALDEIARIGTIESVCFEGGEPFLFYPLMLEGITIARAKGLEAGAVTNAYWATSVEDANLWLKPLYPLDISGLSLSDDLFHYEEEHNPAKLALTAAKGLGMPVGTISVEKPTPKTSLAKEQDKGTPVIGGGVMFRGRAVEKLTEGLPTRQWQELTQCPYEDLEDPKRVHIDSYGNVHLCQGLTMGNMWQTPLPLLVENYDAFSHPICGPLARGGPALLAQEYDVQHEDQYVDECHFCYLARLALIDRFPQYLTPRQVYGLT